MIYTVTLNPSLDYIATVKNFQTGTVNRTCLENLFPGGKGINVSMVLQNLGMDTEAIGFAAGFTGEELKRLLQARGLRTDFVAVKEGMTRINVKLQSTQETEINGMGPAVSEMELTELVKKLDQLSKEDILVLAGNIPAGLPSNLYGTILERLQEKGLLGVVDATGESLISALPSHPFLIKPNLAELLGLFRETPQGGKESTPKELEQKESGETSLGQERLIVHYAKRLQALGARNVLVSLGAEGAYLLTEQGESLQGRAPKGRVVGTVGSGDSMVAGFLTGYLQSGDYEKALAWGICAGSASAFSNGLATRTQVEALLTNYNK